MYQLYHRKLSQKFYASLSKLIEFMITIQEKQNFLHLFFILSQYLSS